MIALGSDHAGFDLKQVVKAYLDERGLEYKDYGIYAAERCNYPEYGQKAALAVASGECDRGIICCGTGVGISIAANKVKGIRCVVCSEPLTAMMARRHNNANMLAMGGRVIGDDMARMIVESWLDNEFEDGGRHAERVALFKRIEDGEIIGE